MNLTYGGVIYPFVSNYLGGTGNDLVLQWANTRLLAWGANASGQLGNGSLTSSSLPVTVDRSGVLAGRTITALSAGGTRVLALCADGALVAWGSGNSVPYLMSLPGGLAGKTITAIAVGGSHSLALYADGTVAAWGANDYGQLGINNQTSTSGVVEVDRTGVLQGKKVVAISAGGSHSLALCSDGTLVAWGQNSDGQLGIGTTSVSTVPLRVDTTGVLAGKRVVAIAGGTYLSMVLCADGSLAAWGTNYYGQLGINSSVSSSVPVLVDRSGALAGKSVVGAPELSNHCLVLCADGDVAAWGYDNYGQLGTSSSTTLLPALVNRTGVMAGKSFAGIASGNYHSLGLCSDGSVVTWGYNASGQLGNATTTASWAPVLVNMSAQPAGERVIAGFAGGDCSFALVASPPPPLATTLAASAVIDAGATLNGSATANGSNTGVTFEYGLTKSYGSMVAAAPANLTGTTQTPVIATIGGLAFGTTYHYRIVATSAYGIVKGEDMSFTTTTEAALAGLTLSSGTLAPAFTTLTLGYDATVPHATTNITVTPVLTSATAMVTVNGSPVVSGTASGPLALAVGNNRITLVVTAAGGAGTQTYNVTVTRLPDVFTFNSTADVALADNGFSLAGCTANFALNYDPAAFTKPY